MESNKQLMQEIFQLTKKIKTEFPDLYTHLNDAPFSSYEATENANDPLDLREYLNTAKAQLEQHMEIYKNSVNHKDNSF